MCGDHISPNAGPASTPSRYLRKLSDTTMKRRRVSAAFVELDSAELIRAKDEEASLSKPRVLASPRNQNRRSPRIAGATAEVDIMLGKKSSNQGKPRTSGGQHMSFNTYQMDDSSHLADIAPKPRDMEHAMPKTSHITERCDGTSLAISNLVAKEDKRRPITEYKSLSDVELQPRRRPTVTRSGSAISDPQNDPSQTSHSEVVSVTNLTSAPSQLEAPDREPGLTGLSMQGRFIPLRPRRSTRKTHTSQTKAEGDWTEADDDSVDRGETSILSADSEHAKSPNKKGKRQRRVSRSRMASGNRRTSARYQAKQTRKFGHAAPGLAVAEPIPPNVNDGTNIPEIEKQQPSRTEVFNNQQTLVTTSSCSPTTFDQAMPDSDFKRPAEQHSLMWDAQGRGKAVGKKLADALWGSKITTHIHQALENGANPTKLSAKNSVSPNSPSTNVPRESSTRITRAQLLLESEIGVEQAKSASSNECGDLARHEPSQMALGTAILSQRMDASLDTTDQANSQPPPAQGRSNSMGLTGHQSGRDEALRCDNMPEDDPQMPRLSDPPTNKPETPLANDRKESGSQILGDGTAVSSQTSVVLEDHHLEASYLPGGRSKQTPDSQQPLLTARSRASVPRSTRRGCAVDHNGSPRLKSQVVTSTGQFQSQLEMDRIWSMTRISDSSSIYSSSSDESPEEYLHEYLPEHQPVARPVWSKFQRDMFKEYGIEAEDLTTQKTGPFLVSVKTENDLYAKSLEDSQKLKGGPAESPTHIDRATSGETNAHSVIQETSLGGPRSGSRRDIDSPGQLSDQRIDATVQGDNEGMEWISALKTAQQTAHDRLLQTNQVSQIY